MIKRSVNAPDTEPDKKQFDLPSPKEHLFQVSDVFTCEDEMGVKLGLDKDTVSVKCEVVGGDEEGRTLLCRLSFDPDWKGFFATRMFLKAIGCQYKGDNFPVDSDEWQGRQFYATVIHKSGYANIKEYNFDKLVDNSNAPTTGGAPNPTGEVEWDA